MSGRIEWSWITLALFKTLVSSSALRYWTEAGGSHGYSMPSRSTDWMKESSGFLINPESSKFILNLESSGFILNQESSGFLLNQQRVCAN